MCNLHGVIQSARFPINYINLGWFTNINELLPIPVKPRRVIIRHIFTFLLTWNKEQKEENLKSILFQNKRETLPYLVKIISSSLVTVIFCFLCKHQGAILWTVIRILKGFSCCSLHPSSLKAALFERTASLMVQLPYFVAEKNVLRQIKFTFLRVWVYL